MRGFWKVRVHVWGSNKNKSRIRKENIFFKKSNCTMETTLISGYLAPQNETKSTFF